MVLIMTWKGEAQRFKVYLDEGGGLTLDRSEARRFKSIRAARSVVEYLEAEYARLEMPMQYGIEVE